MTNGIHWYQKSENEALEEQKTQIQTGLAPHDVLHRQMSFGLNQFLNIKRRNALKIFYTQFFDFMVIVLLGAAVIAGFLGETQDIVAILAIVILNAVLGFVQEYKAERAMEALSSLATPQARVRRLGKVMELPAFELVPGDIVFLEAGNLVPADLRLIEATQLKIDESTLTGESLAIEKTTEAILTEHLLVADQKNMAFKGTSVTTGRGIGLVVGTGGGTELGKIAQLLLEEVEVKTPIQKRIARFAQTISWVVIAVCAVIFLFGALRRENLILMIFTSVSLAVAAIPEALPAVVTVALAMGARRMSKKNALIRKLPAVEALGSVTTICSDKTGTLTLNKMRADRYYIAGRFYENIPLLEKYPELWAIFLKILAQNNDAWISDQGVAQGDPTEVALLEAALQAGVDREFLEKEFPRIAEIPFSSERSMMSTLHQSQKERFLYSKGAPEKIFDLCREHDFTNERAAVAEMAKKGLRVLAFAYKQLPRDLPIPDLEILEKDLSWIGLVGLIDPPRQEAEKSIRLCQSAGIRVVMITGDHPSTAVAIAERLGIIDPDHHFLMSGRELSQLTDEQLAQQIKKISVFARVAPEQKIRIVKAFQVAGEIVAMTGDGVNDAPALRRAEIGVSMGKAGTDVAREASHLVLLDDRFDTIVVAVREGRRIYDNIRKFIQFALAGNLGEILTLFFAPFFNLPVPLLPIQILWVNLVTDGLPGLALAVEPAEKNVMNRPPRAPNESIFAHGMWQHVLCVGLLIAASTLSVQIWAFYSGITHWQSMVFTVLTLVQMGHVLAIRSEKESVLNRGFFTNLPLLGSVVLTVGLQMCALYVPAFNLILKTKPLNFQELMVCIVVSCSVFIAVEIKKKSLSSGNP